MRKKNMRISRLGKIGKITHAKGLREERQNDGASEAGVEQREGPAKGGRGPTTRAEALRLFWP